MRCVRICKFDSEGDGEIPMRNGFVDAVLTTGRIWNRELIGFIIRRMKTIMKLNDLRSIDRLRDFLEGTQAVALAVVTKKDERYQ